MSRPFGGSDDRPLDLETRRPEDREPWRLTRRGSARERSFVIPSKIFVGNLNYRTTKERLSEHLAPAGQIVDVYVPTDRATGRPRGFAFVEFSSEEEAQAAVDQFHRQDLDGRPLNINFAEERRRSPGGGPPRGRRPPGPPSHDRPSHDRGGGGYRGGHGGHGGGPDRQPPRTDSPPPYQQQPHSYPNPGGGGGFEGGGGFDAGGGGFDGGAGGGYNDGGFYNDGSGFDNFEGGDGGTGGGGTAGGGGNTGGGGGGGGGRPSRPKGSRRRLRASKRSL
ncbi:MAG: RNA-binding protein [Acidobacteriota bacterium]